MNTHASNSPQNPTRWLLVALLSSIASIGFLAYLARLHYLLKLGLSEGPSVCNINDKVNCDVVSLSKFSSLFEVPLASWGALTHVVFCLLIVISLIGLANNPRRLQRLALLLSLFIFAMSMVMGFISTFLLHAFCLFCIVAYGLSIVMLFAMWKAVRDTQDLMEDVRSLWGSQKWVTVCLLLIPVGGYLSHSMTMDSYGLGEIELIVKESVESWKVSPEQNFNLDTGIKFGGKADSEPKAVVVEFADYLCPHCAHAYTTLHNYLNTRTDVVLLFKSFPLDGTCNTAIQQKGDGVRCDLAYAAFCADKVAQKGNETQKYIFERQASWNRSGWAKDLSTLIQTLGLPQEEMMSCISATDTQSAVMAQAEEGAKAQIRGTPTLFVNKRQLDRGNFAPVLSAALQSL